MEAMKKILEAEKMEEKRRRKAMKIAHMVNTQSSSNSFGMINFDQG
jgi:hypothetical protein